MKMTIDSDYCDQSSDESCPGLENDPGRRMMLWNFIERAHAHPTQGNDNAAAAESDAYFQSLLQAAGPITEEGKAT